MRFFLVLLCVLAFAREASTQIAGRVVDGAGNALPGATVDLWGARERLATTRADSGGVFFFPRSEGAVGLLAQRIGFAPARSRVTQPARDLVLQMAEAALGLEGLVVGGRARSVCPNRESAEARALWEAAATRYSRTPDTLGIVATAAVFRGEAPRAELGRIDETRLRPASIGTGNVRRRVHGSIGYGARHLPSTTDGLHARWLYVPLGSHAAGHFVDPSFGEFNTLSIRHRGRSGVVLAFCSRSLARGAVGVEGTLTVAPDTTLAEATWRYRAPEPREDVGGEVTFSPFGRDDREPWLVPARSLYWRRLLGTSDRYVQEWVRYDAWAIAPPGSGLHNGRRISP
jgi:hypothetical protein